MIAGCGFYCCMSSFLVVSSIPTTAFPKGNQRREAVATGAAGQELSWEPSHSPGGRIKLKAIPRCSRKCKCAVAGNEIKCLSSNNVLRRLHSVCLLSTPQRVLREQRILGAGMVSREKWVGQALEEHL